MFSVNTLCSSHPRKCVKYKIPKNFSRHQRRTGNQRAGAGGRVTQGVVRSTYCEAYLAGGEGYIKLLLSRLRALTDAHRTSLKRAMRARIFLRLNFPANL